MAHIAIITINDRCCIGARTLSSIAKQGGHKASLIFFGEYNTRTYQSTVAYYGKGNKTYARDEEILAQLLHEIDPDVVAFSFRSVSESIVADIAEGLRNSFRSKPILFGGIGATSNPSDCIVSADYLCEGEADFMLVPFLDVFDKTKTPSPEDFIGVPNLWINTPEEIVKNVRAKLVVDLDTVPFIDYEPQDKYTISAGSLVRNDGRYDNEVGAYPLLSSRGCPFLCSYCHNSLVKQLYRGEKYCRRKSPEAVMNELRHEVRRNPNIRMISVYDDSFPDKKGWLDKFVPMYKKEIRLPYWCYIHPEFVSDHNIRLLVESGATNVAMGCQSFSERTLNEYHRPTRVSKIREAFAILKKFDINVQIDLISWNPLETDDDRRATFMFLLDLDRNTGFNSSPSRRWTLSISRLTLFPHTVMFDRIADKAKTTGEFTPTVKDPKREEFWEMLYGLTFYDFLPRQEMVRLSCHYEDFIARQGEPKIANAIAYIVDSLVTQRQEVELYAMLDQLAGAARKFKCLPIVAEAVKIVDRCVENNRAVLPDLPTITTVLQSPPISPREREYRGGVPAQTGCASEAERLVQLGWRKVDGDKLHEAMECFEKAVGIDPSYVPGQYGYAATLLRDGRLVDSSTVLNQVLSIDPSHSLALNDLGVIAFQRGEYRSALTCFQRSISSDPRNLSAGKNLADFLTAAGDAEGAATMWQKILADYPDDIDALMASGNMCIGGKRKKSAIFFFKRVVELDPQHAAARERLLELGDAPPVSTPVQSSPRNELWQHENMCDVRTINVTKLSRIEEFEKHSTRSAEMRARRMEEEKQFLESGDSFGVPGVCYICKRDVEFLVDYQFGGINQGELRRPNWRERLVCPHCGLNNRIRASIQLFEQILQPKHNSTIYITEQTTPLHRWLAGKYPRTIGSEYLGKSVPFGASNHVGLRNESLTRLSFADGQFDFLLSFEVFEHIPDYIQALRECSRVLKPGGRLLFTVPFVANAPRTITRAVLKLSGEIEHLLPPEYHGDPVNEKGCLAYYHFGWDLLDDLRNLGFDDVALYSAWSDQLGNLGDEQLMFVAGKSSDEVPVEMDMSAQGALVNG